ncbi:neurogenic locus Notch protein isoform X2 [Patella vulgata]|uniref:neurogenic locus Notch protein isoform X2 n=1 Tax=Patella vulgata TaxID=6465 RepID=UPI0024A9606A|nr:neurogenic locus Notch protein isoform X2 [Patella vulgata]
MRMSLRLVTLALVLGFTCAGSVGSTGGISDWINSWMDWGLGSGAQTAPASQAAEQRLLEDTSFGHDHIDMSTNGIAVIDQGFPVVTLCPVNVMFILDGSDSVSPLGFGQAKYYLKNAIRNVTNMYKEADVGVIMFSNGISQEIELKARNTFELNQLYLEIDGLIQPRGQTDLYLALRRAHTVLGTYRPNEGKAIVLISDGCPNNVAKSKAEATYAWSKGVYVVSIAIEKAQVDMLKKLSFRIQDISTPIDWKYTVACPPSTLPQLSAGLSCSDIMIVMDGSDSAGKQKSVIKNYLANLADRFYNVRNQMGVVVYGTDVDSVIPLTLDKSMLSETIINDLRIPATGTATSKGIERAVQILQSDGRTTNKVIILITDGPPLDPNQAALATRAAINSGIRVIVIGVGTHLQYSDLVSIAGGVTQNIFQVESFLDLYSLNFTDNVCGTPTVRCNNPCSNGNAGLLRDVCTCTCNAGWTGTACDVRANICPQCENGGYRSSTSSFDCRCICLPGFSGPACEMDMCRNLRNSCNGNVSPTAGGCQCICRAGYTGQNCDVPICTDSNICTSSERGVAFYNVNTRACGCQCRSGYTGSRCERIDCTSTQCKNGGTPALSGTSCYCRCPSTHTGTYCDTPVVVCQSCRNGGYRASTSTYDCSCTCPAGYSGQYCEIDACQNIQNSCQNGRLVRSSSGCACQCNVGFSGSRCDTCFKNCANGGTPYVSNGACLCSCASGFTGELCSRALNPCPNTRCNGGTPQLINDRCVCLCQPGFTGEGCTDLICIDVRDCNSNGRSFFFQNNSTCGCNCNQGFLPPNCGVRDCSGYRCANGGSPASSGSSCLCNCPRSFTGPNCDTPVCQPCLNGGVRSNSNTGCSCTCRAGFTGPVCEVDECNRVRPSCYNGVATPTQGGCQCRCNTGITGTNCDRCLTPCQNGGTQSIVSGGCVCRCRDGYSGTNCEIEPRCLRETCSGRGTARLLNDACACDCNPGFTGAKCDALLCTASDCSFRGTAFYNAATSRCGCNCNSGYIGETCQNRDCSGYQCFNGGRSNVVGDACSCTCLTGYTGLRCETRDCSSYQCQNDGRSVVNGNTCVCQCQQGFTGTRCETRDCSSYQCQNDGRSVVIGNTCRCQCQQGFTGTRCETRDCSSYQCQNNGRSVVIGNTCRCQCQQGFIGTRCETRDCSSYQCQNDGRSVVIGNTCRCQCQQGFTGTRCETRDCSSYQCQNNGRSVVIGNTCRCQCQQGFIGTRCETRDCSSYQCQNDGRSVVIGNTCGCQCQQGFTGSRCETRECSNYGCRNGGVPAVSGTSCYCRCTADYSGTFCDSPTCSSFACQNGGNAISNGNTCSCRCPSSYTGLTCDTRVCDRFTYPCENGGTPYSNGNQCACTCTPGFSGQTCGRSLCANFCDNGGIAVATQSGCTCNCPADFTGSRCEVSRCDSFCVNGAPTTTYANGCGCNCDVGYTGQRCDSRDPCLTINCMNGQKVPVGGTCQCQCRLGFTGSDCSRSLCSRSNCNNHGSSVYSQATGTCQCFCDSGFSGPDCAGIAPCRTDCLNGVGRLAAPGQCFCDCEQGFTGTYCETPITTEQCTGSENLCQNGQPSIRNSCTGQCQCACSRDFAGAYCEIRIEADLCDECHWRNGVGYTYVRNRCDMYVTCIQLDTGYLTVARECAPGTFWDNEKLTCVAVGSGSCAQDPCRNLAPFSNYSHNSECQEFYTCGNDGTTQGRSCCEAGWGFDINLNQCKPDASCKGVCKRSAADSRAATCYNGCDFAADFNDAHYFYRKTNPSERQICGPGTIFNESLCTCDYDSTPPQRTLNCEPDRYLHFDDNIFQPEFTYDNVTLLGARDVGGITNGAGRFTGDDRVLIQRFANSGFNYNYFIIQVRVKPENVLPGQEFAVISNGDCGVNESVSITLTPGQAHFKVQPQESSPSILSAACNTVSGEWLDLELHYIKNEQSSYTFFGKVNGAKSNEVAVNAPIADRKCAVQVGQGYGYRLLQGYVDWVKIYTLCDPNDQLRG